LACRQSAQAAVEPDPIFAAIEAYREAEAHTMDRSVIQERLAETEEQIANGENQIAQQRRLIAELETNGSSASHAKYLLAVIG
jgi:hypothetical protein